MRMKKPPSLSKEKKKTWDAFSKYVRIRDCIKTLGLPDYGECITCDKTVPMKLLQAGHLVPGRHNAGLFSEKGVNAQCYNCNCNLKGNILIYRRKIIEMYGTGADEEIECEARGTRKFTVDGLREMRKDYQDRTDKMMEEL